MSSHILVIDDDISILELFKLAFEMEGYKVSLSQTGFEHPSEVERIAPDLIMLDMHLGQRDSGISLIQQLKDYIPTEPIQIILCTAAQDIKKEQIKRLEEQQVPILYKPFDIDDLLRLVEQSLHYNTV